MVRSILKEEGIVGLFAGVLYVVVAAVVAIVVGVGVGVGCWCWR